jgi:hypothetical protein
MPARKKEMKKILAMAVFDSDFRERVASDPKRAASDLGIKLDRSQLGFLEDVGGRLRALDVSKFEDIGISVDRKVDLVTGDPIGPVAGHASSSVSW